MEQCVAAAVLGDEKPQGGPSARFSSGLGAQSRAFGPGIKLQSQYITCTETLITVITLIRFLHETPTDILYMMRGLRYDTIQGDLPDQKKMTLGSTSISKHFTFLAVQLMRVAYMAHLKRYNVLQAACLAYQGFN